MTATPALDPLTPPDCDLRGMEWMPLYGARLFGSDFDAHANDAEFRAGMQLWWASWNQIPAASLPNDDAALCKLAGLGKDIKTWRKVRERALHGFVECGDGRLYHKALAAFARESWDRRLKDRERKATYRKQQEEKRKARDGTRPETGTERGHGADGDGPGTADRTRCDETGRDAMRRDATLVHSDEARAHKLPADWQPSEIDVMAVKTARPDLTDAQIAAETVLFRNHAEANNRTAHNWAPNWRSWVIKSRQTTATTETFDQRRIREAREAVRNA